MRLGKSKIRDEAKEANEVLGGQDFRALIQ